MQSLRSVGARLYHLPAPDRAAALQGLERVPDYTFPYGFPDVARDLVSKLLVLDPATRLGAPEQGGIKALKAHAFFEGIDWERLFELPAPKLHSHLPKLARDSLEARASDPFADQEIFLSPKESELEKEFNDGGVGSSSGKGAGERSWSRVGIAEGSGDEERKETKIDLDERAERIRDQAKLPWASFLQQNELILRAGPVHKRKGLFSKKRVLILTDQPRLFYVDQEKMVKKGEIDWSPKMVPELKRRKNFMIHTPHKTYDFEDPSGQAHDWVNEINRILVDNFGLMA
ncbi:hypothetical protein BC936DRAFT_140724 [Jimgerdemannia flammicorona]|uniref:PDK1-type PH domain-containing protein n=1 Tax=Jimgerdemannia flammicorona TaxID=994334 RepID=A0A433AD41_9FUNG|nr:hypothetical protein BC936DRAFT_140724 [Jimgerdemannia flammicorona]